MKTPVALHNSHSPIDPALPETADAGSAAQPGKPIAPGQKQSRKIIVLVLLATGCAYTYFTLLDAGQAVQPDRRNEQQAEPLQDQYLKYLKAIEAAKSVTSPDSSQTMSDSVKPKP